MTGAQGHSGGLLASLKQLASTAIEIIATRIELVATEIDEERARIVRALWLAAVGAFCLSLGLLLAVLFLVVLFWDSHRLLVLGLLAVGFLGSGLAAMLTFRGHLSQRPRLFAQTLEELRRDRGNLEP